MASMFQLSSLRLPLWLVVLASNSIIVVLASAQHNSNIEMTTFFDNPKDNIASDMITISNNTDSILENSSNQDNGEDNVGISQDSEEGVQLKENHDTQSVELSFVQIIETEVYNHIDGKWMKPSLVTTHPQQQHAVDSSLMLFHWTDAVTGFETCNPSQQELPPNVSKEYRKQHWCDEWKILIEDNPHQLQDNSSKGRDLDGWQYYTLNENDTQAIMHIRQRTWIRTIQTIKSNNGYEKRLRKDKLQKIFGRDTLHSVVNDKLANTKENKNHHRKKKKHKIRHDQLFQSSSNTISSNIHESKAVEILPENHRRFNTRRNNNIIIKYKNVLRNIRDDYNFKGFGLSFIKSMFFLRACGIAFRIPITNNFGSIESRPSIPSISSSIEIFTSSGIPSATSSVVDNDIDRISGQSDKLVSEDQSYYAFMKNRFWNKLFSQRQNFLFFPTRQPKHDLKPVVPIIEEELAKSLPFSLLHFLPKSIPQLTIAWTISCSVRIEFMKWCFHCIYHTMIQFVYYIVVHIWIRGIVLAVSAFLFPITMKMPLIDLSGNYYNDQEDFVSNPAIDDFEKNNGRQVPILPKPSKVLSKSAVAVVPLNVQRSKRFIVPFLSTWYETLPNYSRTSEERIGVSFAIRYNAKRGKHYRVSFSHFYGIRLAQVYEQCCVPIVQQIENTKKKRNENLLSTTTSTKSVASIPVILTRYLPAFCTSFSGPIPDDGYITTGNVLFTLSGIYPRQSITSSLTSVLYQQSFMYIYKSYHGRDNVLQQQEHNVENIANKSLMHTNITGTHSSTAGVDSANHLQAREESMRSHPQKYDVTDRSQTVDGAQLDRNTSSSSINLLDEKEERLIEELGKLEDAIVKD